MADKPKSGLLQRLGSGFDRYIGGLLGEDLEGLSPEEKSAARRSAIGIIARGLIDPSQGSEALGAVTQARTQQRARGELERRTAAAEAEMPRIAGRLVGGSAGMIETLPGQPEEESRLMTSRYRIDPKDALARLTGTQVGRDVATMAPDLAKLATEGVTGRTVGGSVYNPLTGRFDTAPKTKVPVNTTDLGNRVKVFYNDGSSETFNKGMAPSARAMGDGGGGSMFLTPAEIASNGLAPGTIIRRRDGAVVQKPNASGATTSGNERQQSGSQMTRSAAQQYAANITGESLESIQRMSPTEIEALMLRKGGRVMQGGTARMLSGLPLVGDLAKTIVETSNADLMAPANQGGAGIALQQNPTGAITGADVDAGRAQFPNAMYPINVQAQMIRSILEKGGQVEEYDAKGNKVR